MFTVETIEDYPAFLKTAGYWDSLAAGSDTDTPFISFDWLRIWWKIFGRGKRMLVLVLKQDGIPAAAVPLMRHWRFWRGLPVRAVSFLGDDGSGPVRAGIPGDAEAAGNALNAALCRLSGEDGFDILCLDGLPHGSTAAQLLERIADKPGLKLCRLAARRSPYIRIEGSWEDYLVSRSRNLREKIKRTAGAMTRDGRHTLSLVDSGNIREAMGKVLAVSRNTWKFRKKTAIASSAATAEFFLQYAEHAAGRRQLKIMLLEYDGKPAAFTYELKYKNRDYFLKTGFDENYSRLSPGIFILSASLREAFAAGCREYDLLGSDEGYKTRFTDLVRPHDKYRAFGTGVYGRLLRTVETNAVPLIKRLMGEKRGDAAELTRQPAH